MQYKTLHVSSSSLSLDNSPKNVENFLESSKILHRSDEKLVIYLILLKIILKQLELLFYILDQIHYLLPDSLAQY